MLGSKQLAKIMEEGKIAKNNGIEKFENPYSFTTESIAAYAWLEGYKKA